jgi:hypothetical protein
MQKLATWKNERSGPQGVAGELPSAAALDFHAGASNVHQLGSGEREGHCSAACVAFAAKEVIGPVQCIQAR